MRFPGIYGFGGPDHLGINVSIKNALNNKRPVLFGDGLARRNYIFVEINPRRSLHHVLINKSGCNLSLLELKDISGSDIGKKIHIQNSKSITWVKADSELQRSFFQEKNKLLIFH